MAFCAQCGRPVDAALAFCPSCGATRAPTQPAAPPPPAYNPPPSAHNPSPPAYAPAPSSPYGASPPPSSPYAPAPPTYAGTAQPGPGGPVGTTRSPGMVTLLSIVTLGIYAFFFWWSASREIDAYTQRPGHAHGKIRLSVFLFLGAAALLVVAFIGVISAAIGAEESGGQPSDGSMAGAGVGILAMIVAVPAMIAAVILLYMGMWRVWSAIRDDQARRAHPKPLSPGMMLAFYLIPYVNIVTMWVAIHRTTAGLNDVWAGAGSPPAYAPVA